jgi:hypothetical protein
MKRTIITNAKVEAQPDAAKTKPTVIPSGKPISASASASASGLSPKPFVVPGTIRTGLVVEANELATLFPSASTEVIAVARDLLGNTILESLSQEQAATWGIQDQRVYSELVDESLTISTSAILQTSLHHMDRLQSILKSLAESMLDSPKKGFKFWRNEKSSLALLEESLNELTQLRKALASYLPELKVMQADIQSVGLNLINLSTRLTAQSVAANYLADQFNAADIRTQALTQQSIAMQQLTAHIQSGMVLRQSSLHTISTLVQRIQETVLIALPGWIEKISLVAQAKVLNDTEQYSMGQELQTLIDKLT